MARAGLEIWDEYFPQLVLEDGTFAEQSSHYHLLLSRTALEYWLACRNGAHTLPNGFGSRSGSCLCLPNELLRETARCPVSGTIRPIAHFRFVRVCLPPAHFYGLAEECSGARCRHPLTVFYCERVPKTASAKPDASPMFSRREASQFLRSKAIACELVAHGDTRDSHWHPTVTPAVEPTKSGGTAMFSFVNPAAFSAHPIRRWETYQCAEAQNVTSLDGLSPVDHQAGSKVSRFLVSTEGGTWRALPGNSVEYRSEAFTRIDPRIVLPASGLFSDTRASAGRKSKGPAVFASNRVFASAIPLGARSKRFEPTPQSSPGKVRRVAPK